ncbi:hypothetical protein ABKV19_009179, partial [Rosa sericea]
VWPPDGFGLVDDRLSVKKLIMLKGALRVSMTSPGFIYEPYAPREKVQFFR